MIWFLVWIGLNVALFALLAWRGPAFVSRSSRRDG